MNGCVFNVSDRMWTSAGLFSPGLSGKRVFTGRSVRWLIFVNMGRFPLSLRFLIFWNGWDYHRLSLWFLKWMSLSPSFALFLKSVSLSPSFLSLVRLCARKQRRYPLGAERSRRVMSYDSVRMIHFFGRSGMECRFLRAMLPQGLAEAPQDKVSIWVHN